VAELADAQDSKSGAPLQQTPDKSTPCVNPAERLGVLLGALAAEITPFAPDLAGLLSAWTTLPEPIKIGMLAMVKASGPGREG